MKILHVLDRSVPDLSGYSIRSKYIIETQRQLGIMPAAVTSPKYLRDTGFEEIAGIPYYRCHPNNLGFDVFLARVPFFRERLLMAALERKIKKIVRELSVDVIHAHSPSLCGLPAMAVAKKANIPFVYEMRAFWEDAAVDLGRFGEGSFKYNVSQYMEAKLLRGADAIVTICKGIKSEVLQRVKRENVHIIPNGVDSEKFKHQPKSERLLRQYDLSGKIVAGFIGSFFTFEGLEVLIRVVPQIIKINPNIKFLIVGSGVENENVRKLAKEIDVLDKHVIFTGKVPHEEVIDYYSVMDILVYPRISKRITELVTPLKPLEAMAMEKAVVVSDVGGLKGLVDNGRTGMYFRAGDTNDLAEKILILSRNPQLRGRLGKTARAEVVQHHDWSKIVPKYLDIYNEVIRNKQ